MAETPAHADWLQRLTRLHRYNAYLLGLLLLSGIVLYVPAWRGPLAEWRMPIKWTHIGIGLLWGVLLGFYVADLPGHWRRLRRAPGKRVNVCVALVFAVAWLISGVVLTQDRVLIAWTLPAVRVHDTASLLGALYVAGHVSARLFRLRLSLPWSRIAGPKQPVDDQLARYHMARAMERRRALVRGGQSAVALAALVYGWQWLIKASGSDQTPTAPPWPPSTPQPTPLPASDPPQGGGAAGSFRIYNVAPKLPVFRPELWRFEMSGLVQRPGSWSWGDFLKIPRTVIVRDFHCVTGWSVYHVTWEGVPLSTLLAYAGVQAGATHVKFMAYDNEYTDALTLAQAQLPDIMVAILKDGRPLTQEEGQPARLVVPEMFGYKGVKWLSRIELIDHPHIGFWERLGYSTDAWLRRDHPDI